MIAVVLILAILMTAAVGLFILVRHLQEPGPPRAELAVAHGIGAIVSISLLFYLAASLPESFALNISIGLFVLAALGGGFLLSFHLRGKRLPSAAAFAHGSLAVLGLMALLFALYEFYG